MHLEIYFNTGYISLETALSYIITRFLHGTYINTFKFIATCCNLPISQKVGILKVCSLALRTFTLGPKLISYKGWTINTAGCGLDLVGFLHID